MSDGGRTKITADSEGQKIPSEKPLMRLLSFKGLGKIAEVMEWAAFTKYAPHNWKKIKNPAERAKYIDALIRHAGEFSDGQSSFDDLSFPLDPESGLTHLAHLGACAMMLLHWQAEDEAECRLMKEIQR